MTADNPYWHCPACGKLNDSTVERCFCCGKSRYDRFALTFGPCRYPETPSRKPTDAETLAHAMISCGLATGHGESVFELAIEMAWQVRELREKNQRMRELLQEWVANEVKCTPDPGGRPRCATHSQRLPCSVGELLDSTDEALK